MHYRWKKRKQMTKNWYRYISKIEVAYMIRTQNEKLLQSDFCNEKQTLIKQDGLCVIQLNQVKSNKMETKNFHQCFYFIRVNALDKPKNQRKKN